MKFKISQSRYGFHIQIHFLLSIKRLKCNTLPYFKHFYIHFLSQNNRKTIKFASKLPYLLLIQKKKYHITVPYRYEKRDMCIQNLSTVLPYFAIFCYLFNTPPAPNYNKSCVTYTRKASMHCAKRSRIEICI